MSLGFQKVGGLSGTVSFPSLHQPHQETDIS